MQVSMVLIWSMVHFGLFDVKVLLYVFFLCVCVCALLLPLLCFFSVYFVTFWCLHAIHLIADILWKVEVSRVSCVVSTLGPGVAFREMCSHPPPAINSSSGTAHIKLSCCHPQPSKMVIRIDIMSMMFLS